MATELIFHVFDRPPTAIQIDNAVVAGWTGRDQEAVDHHIAELEAIGVAPPSAVPLFYRVGSALLTDHAVIQVVGPTSSGEVEPLLIDNGETLFLGLGSDHTDRELEAYSVALSKQVCAKPVARQLWRYDEVCRHLDDIMLRSWIRDSPDEAWTPYQEGSVAKIRPLAELIERSPFAARADRFQPGTAMMCGTLGVLSGGVRAARYFRMQMHDPILGRTIEHEYESLVLPAVK